MSLLHIVSLLCVCIVFQVVAEQANVIRLPLVRNQNGQLAAMKQSLTKRASTVPLFNAMGREYLIEVGVGTPAQKFNLNLDTGSSELWVPSVQCPVTMCPKGRYDSSLSSTYQASTALFHIEYGTGNANGTYGIETITVGDTKVANQMVGLVTATENILGVVTNGEQANGILGLGYPGLNAARGSPVEVPFIFNLASTLADPVFSIFLNKHFAFGATGEIMFGGVDAAKYKGALSYLPVVSYDMSGYIIAPNVNTLNAGTFLYWTVPGQAVQAGTFKYTATALQAFILDTGTTLSLIPKEIVDGIASALGNALAYDLLNDVYRCDCSLVNSSATVDFHLSPSVEAISSSPIVVQVPVSELVIPLDTDTITAATTTCIFGITTSNQLMSSIGQSWLLGESVLRSLYTVYDMKNNRVGIAPVNLDGAATVNPIDSKVAAGVGDTNSPATGDAGQKDEGSSASQVLFNAVSCLLPLALLALFVV